MAFPTMCLERSIGNGWPDLRRILPNESFEPKLNQRWADLAPGF